jgi:hypothetical protein
MAVHQDRRANEAHLAPRANQAHLDPRVNQALGSQWTPSLHAKIGKLTLENDV